MVTKASHQFSIYANGRERVLLSAKMSKAGDLYLTLRHASNYRELQPSVECDDSEIKEQRYSIHPSPNIVDKNHIKHTLVSEKGGLRSSHHHTRAIKATHKFAPLFCRRAPNLLNENYDVRRKSGKSIIVGYFDPTVCNLCYGVLVGPAGLSFVADLEISYKHIVRVIEEDIGPYRIVFLVSFLAPAPSYYTGQLIHFLTLKSEEFEDKELREGLERWMDGLDATAALRNTLEMFMMLSKTYFSEIKNEFGMVEAERIGVNTSEKIADFYSVGTRQGGLAKAFRKKSLKARNMQRRR